MTLSNAIKKVEKFTGKTVQVDGQLHSVEHNNQVLEFFKNGREDAITCISTRNVGDESDSMTDYFPNIWHDNITRALNFLQSK